MKRRVVITGVGCVTPLGGTLKKFWSRLAEGTPGVGRISVFDATSYPVKIAAEVRDWSVAEIGEDPRNWERCPRQTVFAIGAGILAARDAGLPNASIDPLRMGIHLGCGEAFEDFPRFMQTACGASEAGEFRPARFGRTALRIFDPESEREYEPNAPAGHLAGLLDAHGPNLNSIAACVSSAQAIGQAGRMIRRGEADVMLAGGSHSTIHQFGLTGFHRLGALSQRNDSPESAVRPFDRDRDGFVIGEGAAVLVLEELEHARARNAFIWGELTGYGSAADAYRVTDTHPDGRGTAAAITRALADAGLAGDSIDYINAHGTGTVLNDRVETRAIKQAFGEQAYRIPISSSKSMLGHATTACGAIELAVCVLALHHGVVPPTINHENPDPECDLDYVPNVARELELRHVLSNSIGFGGQNAAVIVSRFDERSPNKTAIRRAA